MNVRVRTRRSREQPARYVLESYWLLRPSHGRQRIGESRCDFGEFLDGLLSRVLPYDRRAQRVPARVRHEMDVEMGHTVAEYMQVNEFRACRFANRRTDTSEDRSE